MEENKIIQFVQVVKDLPWTKIIAIAVAIAIVTFSVTYFQSCGVWRKTTTYGVTESNYVKFDTIHTKSHVKIPKYYTYEE